MSTNDKKIIIGIQTVGANSAASEIRKVEEAGKDLTAPVNPSTGFGGMLDKLPEQAEKAIVKARDLNAEVDAMVKKIGEVSKETTAAGASFDAAEKKAGNLSKPIEASTVTAAKLGSRVNIVAGIIASLGAISTAVFSKIKGDMEAGTAAGSKFEAQNIKTAAAIQLLGDPAGTVKSGWETIGNTVLGWIDKIVLGDSLAKIAIEENTASVARSKKTAFDKIASDHAAMNQKILAGDLKLQEAQNALDRSREQRGGVTADQSSANEIARIVRKNATENQIIITAIAEAQRIQNKAVADLKNLYISNEEKEEIRQLRDKAKVEFQNLSAQLGLKIQTDALSLQDSVEDAQAKAKSGLESKLTASAESLQTELQAVVDEKGGAAQAGTQMALDTVNGLLAKGKVTLEDATKLEGAARTFYQSADSNVDGLRATTQKLIDSDKQALDIYKALNDQITTSATTQTQVAGVAKVAGESQKAIAENITAANTKAGEVKTAIDGERTNTAEAIQKLAPTPQDTQAITGAVQAVGKAMTEQGNATIKALTTVTLAMDQITAKISAMESKIYQIQSRIR